MQKMYEIEKRAEDLRARLKKSFTCRPADAVEILEFILAIVNELKEPIIVDD